MHSDRPEMQKSPGGAGGNSHAGRMWASVPARDAGNGSVFVEDIPRHGLVEQLLRLAEVAGLA